MIRKPYENFLKNLKRTINNLMKTVVLKIKSGDDIISEEFDLAERFNDYFINIAANLKEPIVESNFDDLQEYIRQKNPLMLFLSYQK